MQIDRKNSYRQLHGLYFPHYADKSRALGHSIIDGELVLDKDPATGVVSMHFDSGASSFVLMSDRKGRKQ